MSTVSGFECDASRFAFIFIYTAVDFRAEAFRQVTILISMPGFTARDSAVQLIIFTSSHSIMMARLFHDCFHITSDETRVRIGAAASSRFKGRRSSACLRPEYISMSFIGFQALKDRELAAYHSLRLLYVAIVLYHSSNGHFWAFRDGR